MKILVLNGSPKRDKSDTMHITRAFLEGMRDAAPQEIHEIDTALLAEIGTPMIPEEQYAAIVNGGM